MLHREVRGGEDPDDFGAPALISSLTRSSALGA